MLQDLASRTKLLRFAAISLTVAVIFMSVPITAFAALGADIKVNGSDGPVTITEGDSFSYSWSSTEATACTLHSPSGDSGISLSGTGGPIDPSHPWYPSTTTPTTLTLDCTDGVNASSDSVTIMVEAAPAPTPAADIKVNGSDGPVTINSGDSFSYSWSSTNATACTLHAPNGDSGISLSGAGGPIDPTHPWYPSTTTPTTLTLDCTDGTNTASDSVVINLAPIAPSAVTADIKANGSDGPITINAGDSWNYSWSSTGATACTLTSPSGDSGISLSGAGGPIDPTHPWYPSTTTPTTLTLDCTDGVNTASDSVVVNLAPIVSPPLAVTADIKANGSDGPVTVNQGDSWTYSWSSTGATACTLTSPTGDSGISINGSGGPIDPSHPWYPTLATSTRLTLNCTNGTNTASDSVVIQVVTTTPPPPSSCPVSLSITSPLSITAMPGEAISYTITSSLTGTSTTATTYAVAGLPADLHFDSATGIISGSRAETGSFTVTLTATNGCATDTKILTITVSNGGGGGGGGGGGSSSGSVSSSAPVTGEILGASTANYCPFLTSYMRIGVNNDPVNVTRLQAFLKVYEGYDYVQITGVFDEATLQAVNAFQLKYKDDILTPWGISAPTGYVYIRTLGKINQILCGSGIPAVHKAVSHISKEGGISKEGSKEGAATGGTVGGVPTIGTTTPIGQNSIKDIGSSGLWHSIATALFSWPSGTLNTLQCLYEFLLILIAAYLIGSVIESVLYRDVLENVRKRFLAKWLAILATLVLAFIVALILKETCLYLPLIITLGAALGYTIAASRKKGSPTPVLPPSSSKLPVPMKP